MSKKTPAVPAQGGSYRVTKSGAVQVLAQTKPQEPFGRQEAEPTVDVTPPAENPV
ncbi:hypothetical protein [Paradevosia shaoguanensis]|uniref:Uncharacterized protein n=1 Tax=Paradevosia shaoguanensis TaxID=1335043 RepID=A0AA41UF30_9HYPH|nr:hypothetical protein [Paradevosia shaoguanensis]MCF1744621.1 hypothetical protein [Paradevosia shaoguanensis]MCI0129104.1 hypothetical protein [Paradevosia shaoguanensis]